MVDQVLFLQPARGAADQQRVGLVGDLVVLVRVIQRVQEVVARLKKSSKPAKLATLKSSIKSWFKPPMDDKAVAAIVQSLQDRKLITVTGAKVAYALG